MTDTAVAMTAKAYVEVEGRRIRWDWRAGRALDPWPLPPKLVSEAILCLQVWRGLELLVDERQAVTIVFSPATPITNRDAEPSPAPS